MGKGGESPKDVMIMYEGKERKVGDLSKNEASRLIVGLLMQRQQIANILFPKKE